MTSFEAQHPRANEGTFTTKVQGTPELTSEPSSAISPIVARWPCFHEDHDAQSVRVNQADSRPCRLREDVGVLHASEGRPAAQRSVGSLHRVDTLGSMPDFSFTAERILHPRQLTRPSDANTSPKEKGIYGWYFTPGSLPVPSAPYEATEGYELLYVGIAPKDAVSKSLLRPRLVRHATGDASRSTLRLTVGVLLTEELGLILGIHQGRTNWGPDGEARLTRWMNEHARIAWAVDPTPWVAEDELLAAATLALNVDGRSDAFSTELKDRRTVARRAARAAG